MMGKWVTASVAERLVRVPVLGKTKVQTKDYKTEGRYPIVDQGQELVAGFTDDASAVIDGPLPLIVFGDHTRTFKFINEPFARGADGTQLLRPVPELDPLFFFYACRAIHLPSRGYNRHLTVLREKEFSYPEDGDEQREIADVLSRVERAIGIQTESVSRLERIKVAATKRLFTHGLKGEPRRETELGPLPVSWEVVPFGSLGKIGSGTTPNRTNPAYWIGGTVPWITSGRVYERDIAGSDEHVTAIALHDANLPRLQPGAVLIAIVGQGKTLGHCALLEVEATISRHVGYIQPDETVVTPGYLRGFLEGQYQYLRQLASGNGSTRGALTGAILKDLSIPLPPTVEEQLEIVEVLHAIDVKVALHKRKSEVLGELFKALMSKLMTGEISVNNLDLSALIVGQGSAA